MHDDHILEVTNYQGYMSNAHPPQLAFGARTALIDQDLLDRACQYIQAELSQPITLTNLEHVSGMSRRSLQSAFQKRYHCTPMQWIRFRRLDQAQSTLRNATAYTTITATALECGFSNASIFSSYYRSRFGELPSKVLAKGKRK